MADNSPAPAMAPMYPDANFPIMFADGAMAITNSPTIVKFFMYRFDPNFAADGRTIPQPFTQVVMPMDGFASMAVFFDIAIRYFLSRGLVTEDRLAEIRKLIVGTVGEPPARPQP